MNFQTVRIHHDNAYQLLFHVTDDDTHRLQEKDIECLTPLPDVIQNCDDPMAVFDLYMAFELDPLIDSICGTRHRSDVNFYCQIKDIHNLPDVEIIYIARHSDFLGYTKTPFSSRADRLELSSANPSAEEVQNDVSVISDTTDHEEFFNAREASIKLILGEGSKSISSLEDRLFSYMWHGTEVISNEWKSRYATDALMNWICEKCISHKIGQTRFIKTTDIDSTKFNKPYTTEDTTSERRYIHPLVWHAYPFLHWIYSNMVCLIDLGDKYTVR